MVCSNCGKEISSSMTTCPYCGKQQGFSDGMYQQFQEVPTIPMIVNTPVSESKVIIKKEKGNVNLFPLIIILFAIGFMISVILYNNQSTDYYFEDGTTDEEVTTVEEDEEETSPEDVYEAVSKSGQNSITASVGVTSVIHDNQYLKQMNLTSVNDVYKLIDADKKKQDAKCSSKIIDIEKKMQTNYGIRAVNICEMDEEFANELMEVTKYIYNNYPKARGNLTNITLANVSGSSYMAAFMPIFTFATSNNSSGYPLGIKTQIVLNAKYFLNVDKIESSVSYGVATNYFPNNATRSSTVAHEFGHYLSYIALLNHYGTSNFTFTRTSRSDLLYEVYGDFNKGEFSYQVIKEAYQNYKGTMSFDEFRESISRYAIAKDSNGNYIYDETIAEAFHDCYLNGNNAKEASRLIMQSLYKYL